jgi:hypothetical protein
MTVTLERPPVADDAVAEYDRSMSKKVRRTVTLDQDVAEFFDSDKEAFSARLNSVLAEEMRRICLRQQLQAEYDRLTELYGPPDPELVERIARDIELAKLHLPLDEPGSETEVAA